MNAETLAMRMQQDDRCYVSNVSCHVFKGTGGCIAHYSVTSGMYKQRLHCSHTLLQASTYAWLSLLKRHVV
jgi:hypothetical protein